MDRNDTTAQPKIEEYHNGVSKFPRPPPKSNRVKCKEYRERLRKAESEGKLNKQLPKKRPKGRQKTQAEAQRDYRRRKKEKAKQLCSWKDFTGLTDFTGTWLEQSMSEQPSPEHSTDLPDPHTYQAAEYSGSENDEKPFQLQLYALQNTVDKPFACTLCPKSFALSRYLKAHVRIHSDEKEFACSLCPKAYVQKEHLILHERSHTGEKPFVCAVCTRAFTRKQLLTNHERLHTGEKPFQCVICGRKFTAQHSMHQHQRKCWLKACEMGVKTENSVSCDA